MPAKINYRLPVDVINLVAVRRKESCRGHGIFFYQNRRNDRLEAFADQFLHDKLAAPAPKERRHFQVVKRLPLILAAVSISMRSCFFQARCGQAVQNQNGFSPTVFTTTLSFSSFPSGTESSAGLGISKSSCANAVFNCASSGSNFLGVFY